MSTLLVEGGRPLSGSVRVEGNKNAALPLLAACLLTDETVTLSNMPRIADVRVMAELLEGLGAEVEGVGTTTVRVRCAGVRSHEPDPRLVGRMRGSVLLAGPLLARLGRASLAAPGGDFPSRRAMSTHVQALRALGVRDEPGDPHVFEAPDGLRAASFYLPEASVTATETAILAAAGADGTTEIRNAACEPHVAELCACLRSMGIAVEGAGTPAVRVTGGTRPRGAEHRIRGDAIEAGSWAVVAAITGGEIEVRGAAVRDLEPITAVLGRMDVHLEVEEDRLVVSPSRLRAAHRITTAPWPGFPTDLVSLVTVLATQAEGRTLMHDWMYELRLFALEQLSSMGASLFLCDPHRILVDGATPLRGRKLDSRDIRSGMALIAAALAADGESRISPLETVRRGYANLPERLRSLGAEVAVEA